MIVDIIRSMGGVRGQIQINVFDMRVADTNPPFTIRRPTGVGRQNFPDVSDISRAVGQDGSKSRFRGVNFRGVRSTNE